MPLETSCAVIEPLGTTAPLGSVTVPLTSLKRPHLGVRDWIGQQQTGREHDGAGKRNQNSTWRLLMCGTAGGLAGFG